LDSNAGRHAALDEIAKKFVAATNQKELLAEATKIASTLVGEAAQNAKFYLKAMEKLIAEGQAFLKNEAARLKKLAESPSTNAAKIDEFTVRGNILGAF